MSFIPYAIFQFLADALYCASEVLQMIADWFLPET